MFSKHKRGNICLITDYFNSTWSTFIKFRGISIFIHGKIHYSQSISSEPGYELFSVYATFKLFNTLCNKYNS